MIDKIILANPRGFCAGVNRAINIVEKVLHKYGKPIYVRHKLVHNDYVINDLSKRGVIFVEEIDAVPNKSVLIFSAHGVSKKVREQAKNKNLTIFDATCPLVSKVHMEVSRANKNYMEVILIGHFDHPEVEGTIGQYIINNHKKQIYLIESKSDAWLLEVNDPNNLSLATQTTLSIDSTKEICAILQHRFPKIVFPRKNDICYATFNRQNALKKLTLLVDIILVIGSKDSSNSMRLLELANNTGKLSYLIEHVNDIQKQWFFGIKNIGITAGASAPDILINQVIEKLSKFSTNDCVIEEMVAEKEDIFFNIPNNI
ncbi:4-hydroxy-3-methylbut-2-enyl diphosphate reductase [Candidatus Blochmannia ocreatus (nom. nud.)]|uniref:4-hydroxy-3-methylbut-2-enyl diphosphate reductase n=1 Tax=Candidatus Blochmannia ocreatus (nom. nud.) TaxID=251538 RepID=A0ABY4SY52_9ENTR|nr:4-hydroxy-3-methylbut-2-enyl diphosphate reductase [Candidatus Blochmannia ocreatus]URJ25203.1 4-hydroxy-3-methylbut-2-enyl diphosphate reductase [Candidatus Blochmannia ocreatus]